MSPGKYNKNNCDLSAPECSNCVLLVEKLNSALEEIKSTRLIINFLRQESAENFYEDNRINEATNSPSNMNAIAYSNGHEHNKWTVTTTKHCRKGFSSKNITEMNGICAIPTANHYGQLPNLQNALEQDATLQIQDEINTSHTPNSDYQNKQQHQRKIRTQRIVKTNRENPQVYNIPTLRNGKTENRNLKTVLSEVTHTDHAINKNRFREHKVTMIGDSLLRGIWEPVELSLSNKFSTYRMVKPGCELKPLPESANRAAENLTQKDAVICGSSNDFNFNLR